MASTVVNFIVLVISLVLGIGITYFGTGLLNEAGFNIDQQTQIIAAVIVSLFAFLALYFMAKGRGGGG